MAQLRFDLGPIARHLDAVGKNLVIIESMKRMILLCALTILGCGVLSHKLDSEIRRPATVYSESAYGKAGVAPSQNLRFDDLKDLLIKNKITSIEQALPILSAKYADYLRFHTLMYGSFSIQKSSFEEPRALVFGPDAKFIFSFNGNPSQMGGTTFESVEYSDQIHSFRFREIAFKKYPGFDTDELNLAPEEIAFQNENIVISKPNPAKCLLCHGQNASPIWQTYFLWPGAYGSDDDQLGMSFDTTSWNANNAGFFKSTQKPSSQGRRISIKPGFSDAELEGLVRYAKAKPQHPRYRWLPSKIVEVAAVQYAVGVPFSSLDFSKQVGEERSKFKAGPEWPTRPNFFFLLAIQRLNSDRLAARLIREGLKDAFVSPLWEQLFNGRENLQSRNVIPLMAQKIQNVIAQFTFKNRKPTLQQIESLLTTNLEDEFGMQWERIQRQADNLGRNAIQYQPYISIGDNGTFPEGTRLYREGMPAIQNAQEFYTQLMGLKKFTEVEKIAVSIETDNQFMNTAVAILLSDRGIDLHDYTTNLRQTSITFHTGGLDPALQYLGILKRN